MARALTVPAETSGVGDLVGADAPIARASPAKVGDLSLPADLRVDTAAFRAPGRAPRFAGVWVGHWGDVLPHALVVERVAADGTPHVVYAVGDAPSWGIARAWFRAAGTVDDGKLVLDGPRARVSYELDRSGQRLLGAYVAADGQLTVGVLERADPGYLTDAANMLPCPRLGETVRIPHRSAALPGGSRSIALEGTLYRPDRTDGLRRLAIINHGSSDGVSLRQTLRHDAQARWLLELGFVVLVPMRRGRGASEGVCGETSCCGRDRAVAVCRQGLEEAVEDLGSAIAHGLALPEVDGGQPVLLVGQSRGGLLSAVYAGRFPGEVTAVVSFAGGWTADWCNGAVNADALVEAAPTARVPQLWLYGEKDRYYRKEHIRANHAAFVCAGGQAGLEILPVPGDGHRLISYPTLWRGLADAYITGQI